MIVLVHGVPESAVLWDRLRALLGGPSTALALPGFACERPESFGATKDDYAAWLIGALETIGEPVDLVGHDWGAALTYRVATTRGDLLRSWSADVANVLHPAYVWHDLAQIWQTAGAGEEFFASQAGVPAADTGGLLPFSDTTMAACILDLYRSALPRPFADWGNALGPTGAPGLVLHAAEDPFGDEEMSAEVAALLGARQTTLAGVGHWWALQDPSGAAAVLNAFHASVD